MAFDDDEYDSVLLHALQGVIGHTPLQNWKGQTQFGNLISHFYDQCYDGMLIIQSPITPD